MTLSLAPILCLVFAGHTFAKNIHDVSRLEEESVTEIAHVHAVDEIQNLVRKAIQDKRKISIAGARHSQGGHIFYPNALVLDMTAFRRVLNLDLQNKVITVESGATWADVQNYVNEHGLAVKVMQASNIFTVGGSLSVNAHGRDPRYGSVVDTVRSFRLLTPDGTVRNVSRAENEELFQLAIGGYGLFGVILDVDISLTDNKVYRKKVSVIPREDYPAYFEKIKLNRDIELHFAWPSISRSKLFEEILIADYETTNNYQTNVFELKNEQFIGLNKFFLEISRISSLGKSIRWFLQKNLVDVRDQIVSRNNAMRPEVKFLDYDSSSDTDILQEYFFPVDKYSDFMSGLKKIIKQEDVNLLSMTLRYVPKASEPFLRYAGTVDCFSAVLYINQGLSSEEKQIASGWTQKIVDLTLSLGGKHYLAYQKYPTRDQVRSAYPQIESFFAKKKSFDPQEVFFSSFYEYYR